MKEGIVMNYLQEKKKRKKRRKRVRATMKRVAAENLPSEICSICWQIQRIKKIYLCSLN